MGEILLFLLNRLSKRLLSPAPGEVDNPENNHIKKIRQCIRARKIAKLFNIKQRDAYLLLTDMSS